MERNIGSKFEFLGVVLKVTENKEADCNGCFMFEHNLQCRNDYIFDMVGSCFANTRSDNKDVIFEEIN